jgi:mRNA-degrading endonuclease YafQ of YafQ-DinJ toxin-antitoxin module
MWEVLEHRRVDRQVAKAPLEILKRYEKWKDLATLSGPAGLSLITGFHDEALAGKWRGWRSSRLGLKWRVVYRTAPNRRSFYVEAVTPHDYQRP